MTGEYPRVMIPLEAWRHVGRRIAQLEQLHEQQGALLRSLVDAVHAATEEDVR
jgi:hypothetical protein